MSGLETSRVSPAQLRAARSLLNYSLDDMAGIAGISKDTLSPMERGIREPHRDTLAQVLAAYDRLGIVFTTDNGVRQRNDLFRILEGATPYLDLLEDAFSTMKGTKGEILFFYVDNSKSRQAVIDSDLRMRHDGIRFRSLIDENNPYCLYPLKEYRCVPSAQFHNNPVLVYADKVGSMIDASPSPDIVNKVVHLTRNASLATAMRCMFEAIWQTHKMPKETMAPVTYD